MMVQTMARPKAMLPEEFMKAGKGKLIGAVLFSIGVTILVCHYRAPTESDAVMAASKLAA